KDASFFIALNEVKEKAKKNNMDQPGSITYFLPDEVWLYNMKPHGAKGFSWILSGSDFTYKIAESQEPNSRPNVMAEVRSETLWRLGPEESMKIVLGLIAANGGHRIEAKLSRVDLCVDFVMPDERWSQELMDYAVTRATDYAPYYRFHKLTGIRIGKGTISARLYDKPLEIQQQSKKEWMYDVWGIEDVPEGHKLIRIEFQMRREVLKQLGLNKVADLLQKTPNAWAYCTKNWLKFQDRPGLHHTQRSTLKWYEEIQEGFEGVQGAEPLVREKAVNMDKKRLMQQANGLIKSIHAIDQEEERADREKTISMDDCLASYKNELRMHPESPSEIKANVTRKRARYHREIPKLKHTENTYRIDKNMNFKNEEGVGNEKEEAVVSG
ncbi:MAG: hypothetical protein LLG97_06460, partial [Deltaproteobacteria bacterium]|nr:hypothetical protein [Deltaproteobacteria bacterium]